MDGNSPGSYRSSMYSESVGTAPGSSAGSPAHGGVTDSGGQSGLPTAVSAITLVVDQGHQVEPGRPGPDVDGGVNGAGGMPAEVPSAAVSAVAGNGEANTVTVDLTLEPEDAGHLEAPVTNPPRPHPLALMPGHPFLKQSVFYRLFQHDQASKERHLVCICYTL